MSRILIAGCGDVGTRAGMRLAVDGDEVIGVTRTAVLPDKLTTINADLTDPDDVARLPTDVDQVVFAAAAGRRDPGHYQALYVEAQRLLSDHLGDVDRWLFTSSTTVYGQADGSWVDEDSPTEPTSETGRIMLAAERTALDSPGRGIVLRLAGIYGPGRTRMLDRIRAGELTIPREQAWTNRIHSDDAAAGIVRLLGLEDPPAVCIGVDDEPARLPDVATWLAERLGAPAPRTTDEPWPRGDGKRLSNARLRSTGWRPEYRSFREGYTSIIGSG